MDKDFIKEKIRIHIEWLRGLFVLLVIIGGSTTALFITKSFMTSIFDKVIVIIGISIVFLIIIFILIFNYTIHQYINKLKR